jgi:steroid delta-isomerase
MAASPEKIREVIEQYVARVASGSADDVLALYAEDATVEDPVGTEVRQGKDAIREFYAPLEAMQQDGRVVTARVAGGQAAFLFELATAVGEKTYTLSPIDVMTFDDDGLITSMRAYWGDADLTSS